ncbi:carboxypeptidase-like regulatory domain-containing protein [Psychroflexus sp. MBR-150]
MIKKKYINFILTLACFTSLNAQKYIVVDSLTKRPLKFANIQFLKVNKGTYTDYGGFFFIKNKILDSISISHLGYTTKKEKVLRLDDTVFLTPKIENLKEVILKEKINFKEVGLHKKRSNLSWSLSKKGSEFFMRLTFNKKYRKATIETVLIPIKKSFVKKNNTKSFKAILRVNIYSDNHGNNKIYSTKPKEFLTSKKQMLEFDISKSSIKIDNKKIFIGIELIGFKDENGFFIDESENLLRISFTSKKTKNIETETFLRYIFEGNNELESLHDYLRKYDLTKKKYNLQIGFNLAFYGD